MKRRLKLAHQQEHCLYTSLKWAVYQYLRDKSFVMLHTRRNSHLLKYICLGLLIVLPLHGFAKSSKKSSRWADTPVVIDGSNLEWPQPYPFTDEIDTKMQYAIANDAQTLYLTLKTSDATSKMKLRRNGLTIFVDTSGKKLMTTSFGFSVADETKPAPRHRGKSAEEKHDTDTTFSNQKLHITSVQVIGTPRYDGTYKMEDNNTGISAAATVNDFNELVWEIAIPFKYVYTNVAENVSDRKRISVCFTLFGLNDNDIFELNRAADKRNQNAMPVAATLDSAAQNNKKGDNEATPVIGANGVGVGIGGGKGKGGAGSDPVVIDAVAAMQDRQRAVQDNQVWKLIRLSYEK